MNRSGPVWIGMILGSVVGSYIPSLWGASMFSLSSVVFAAVGGFLGIWIGYQYR